MEKSVPDSNTTGAQAGVSNDIACDVLIVGAGIIGIATAHYLKTLDRTLRVVLVDAGQPMSFTSAQSGENYRNWWPHPIMTAFTNHSIDLMEQIARESDDRIGMSRRGYVLATREGTVDEHLAGLEAGYAGSPNDAIRVHDRIANGAYQAPVKADWRTAPSGVDVLQGHDLVRRTFPSFAHDIRTVIHIRRAGAISAQQMGQHLLERYRAAAGVRVTGTVRSIERADSFRVRLSDPDRVIRAERLVNAAGPFVGEVATMLGVRLPIRNTLQQKIAFEDTAAAIPRTMPFSIDLDAQRIDWDEEERALLAAEPDMAWLTRQMPGSVHCRPDGGDRGTWVKLGWAYNDADASVAREPALAQAHPEIVLKGAARLNPALKVYDGHLPRSLHHYGGYYTRTEENWPLIGEMGIDGAFVVGAMSGFGTLGACAAGDLCARWITGDERPAHADALAPGRYANEALMAEIAALPGRGIL